MAENHTYYLASQDRTIGPLALELGDELKALYQRFAKHGTTNADGASVFEIDGERRTMLVLKKKNQKKSTDVRVIRLWLYSTKS